MKTVVPIVRVMALVCWVFAGLMFGLGLFDGEVASLEMSAQTLMLCALFLLVFLVSVQIEQQPEKS